LNLDHYFRDHAFQVRRFLFGFSPFHNPTGGMLTTTGLPLDETEEEEEAEEAEKAGRRRYAGRARELVKVTVISASSSSTAVIALGVSADDEATDEGDGGGRGGAVLARSCAHCSSTASTHAVDITTCNGDAAVKESLAPPRY